MTTDRNTGRWPPGNDSPWRASSPRSALLGRPSHNALAETINGLYKTELIKKHGPWRGVDHVEIAPARVGRLVQPPPPLQILRRPAAGRVGGRSLRSDQSP